MKRVLKSCILILTFASTTYGQTPTVGFTEYSYAVSRHGGIASVPVRRTDTGTNAISVDYFTSDGTAKAGEDYLSRSGRLTFMSGPATLMITIPIINDCALENDEFLRVTLTNPSPGMVHGWFVSTYLNILNNERAGSLDLGFHPFNDLVDSLALQPDGKVLVGTFYDEGITRLNPNGTLDETFDRNGLGRVIKRSFVNVHAICVQSDQKIVVVASSGDSEYWFGNYIARLEGDGTGDYTFNCPLNTRNTSPGSFGGLAVQSDGKILVGGRGVPGGIVRLLPSGAVDPTFDSGTGTAGGPWANGGAVGSIALQRDGRIVVGGAFTPVNETNQLRIARLHSNGSIDSSFVPDPSLLVTEVVDVFNWTPMKKSLPGGFWQI